MTFATSNFGDIEQIARAIGLIQANGSFNDDWLSRPGDFLASVLSNDAQRLALLGAVDGLLGGGVRETDHLGQIWLPVFESQDPPVAFYAVVNESAADHIKIGLGAKVTSANPVSKTRLHLPLFKAARGGNAVSNPILLGQPGGKINFSSEITVDSSAPAAGQAHLRAVGLSFDVPTDGAAPDFGITLSGLLLPGALAPRDLNLSLANVAALDDIVLDLVLGLLEAQARGASGAVSAFAKLIGLSAAPGIPVLPVARLGSEGVRAIASWAAQVFADTGSRDAWILALKDLLGPLASVSNGRLSLALGAAKITVDMRVSQGSGGFPVIAPILGIETGAEPAVARLEAELFRLNLGTFSAVALPSLDASVTFGKSSAGGSALLAGDPSVDAVKFGIALNEARRPAVLLALTNVKIGAHPAYPVLDLSSPGAVVEAAGQVIGSVLDQVLNALGSFKPAVQLLFGFAAPTGAAGLALTDIAAFLSNPLAALRNYWRSLVFDHPAAVPQVLAALRDIAGEKAAATVNIDGLGTAERPWVLTLSGPLKLQVWRAESGHRLEAALAASYSNDNLGERCTVLMGEFGIGLASIDLDGGPSSFLSSISAGISGRPRGARKAAVELPPLRLSADSVGLIGRWTPALGLKVSFSAPNPSVSINRTDIPLDIPDLSQGFAALSAAQWDAVELIAGQLAQLTPQSWVHDLLSGFGWGALPSAASGSESRLRLSALIADPQAELVRWLTAFAIQERSRFERLLTPLARVLTGTAGANGVMSGQGSPKNPWRVALSLLGQTPELAFWIEPDGPPSAYFTAAPEKLRSWRPGMQGLSPSELADALEREAAVASDIFDLASHRDETGNGLGDLIERWTGTDGRILPPPAEPAGTKVHILHDAAFDALRAKADIGRILGAAPATLIRIAAADSIGQSPWPNAPAARLIDLTAQGLAPNAFEPPAAQTGEWFILLGGRSACRMTDGDPDGVAGQAARLSHVLQPFRALGGTTALVAEGSAGFAARRAANSIAEIGALVMLGTPAGPVAFSILTAEPAASALRLLRSLIPAETIGEPFDADLALGRDLVKALTDLADAPETAADLAPPADIGAPLRPSLSAHAVFGHLSHQAASSALTAIFAAGMSTRSGNRAAFEAPPASGFGAGIRLPIALGGNGVIVTGHAAIEAFGVDIGAAGPSVRQSRPLMVHLEVRRRNGWLIGGPGAAGGQDLRWLEANLTLPVGTGGAAHAEIVLHEPRVFSIRRDRWIIRSATAPQLANDIATTALPEVGILLSGVMRELALDSDLSIGAFLDLLEAIGVFSINAAGGQGGFVASALNAILNQPAEHFAGLLASPALRQELQSALEALAAPVSGLSFDLAHKSLNFDLSGVPGAAGMAPWNASFGLQAGGVASGSLRLGEPGACVRLNLAPPAAVLEWPRIGQPGSEMISLFPGGDAARLVNELPSVLAASAIRIGLDYLRDLDDGARPFIDAILDAAGLLSGAAGDTGRNARIPLNFLADPVAWFRNPQAFGGEGGTFEPARIAAFVDALKPLLGLAGPQGQIALAPGAAIAVSGVPGNALQLALVLDSAAFTPAPGNPPHLSLGGTFGVAVSANGAVAPVIEAFAGLPGTQAGKQALHLSVGSNVSLFIRPAAGADISVYPNPPGLGSVAGAALQVVPFVLDEVAKLTAPGAPATAAALVRAIGDALDLRSGAQPKFDAAKLANWAENPAQRFADRLPSMLAASLQPLVDAIRPALPAGLAASAQDGALVIDVVGFFSAKLAANPFAVIIAVSHSAIPFAGRVAAELAFDAAGLTSFSGSAGPGEIDVGGIILRPQLGFAAGQNPIGGARIELGGALDALGLKAVFARWQISSGAFSLVAKDGAGESADPAQVALGILNLLLDFAAGFVLKTDAVTALLAKTVPNTAVANTTVKKLLEGVFLTNAAAPAILPDLFVPELVAGRFMQLLRNIATAGPQIEVADGLTVGFILESQIAKLTLGVTGRVAIAGDDIKVSIEADSRWIKSQPVAGLAIGFVNIGALPLVFAPSLSVNGLGIRISRTAGPLVDTAIKLGSVAAHFFADVKPNVLLGGVQLQLSDLAVGASGASGGNAIAQGIMSDTGSGSNALAPAFSPALAIQTDNDGRVLVSLSAGEGDGPWWLSIQRGFGPLYVEQVGFGVTVRQDQLEKISVLFDGRVSIAGLVAAVDDLQITFTVTSGASLFDASRWAIDLAGLAVNADIAGVTLAGGLRKFGSGDNLEYVGMLMARVATYGLSIYGGYGTGVTDGERFTAFFAFGAVTGPIGGPPAFFVTGIGGGFGINRDLVFPQSLSTFADFVMIKALDPSAASSPDPLQELQKVRDTFPMRRGRYWFAAGISFTSFALVDGIAVVAVSFGDGFELTLLGLARMALPRPQFRLVSIELGLLVRFSTREGVMWIQAELTENSWLLHESVRLTGGFAYVMWFSGERAGEFVLTLGGYHPSFHRDGYPNVPRLGYRWQVADNILIKGENYFALTSEALMAGGAFEASARFGPAWANVSFGANAIIYFDPFRYEADAHARISAGVTIDVWIGEITISISIGARIEVAGPEFHGSATFEVGPIELTVSFGSTTQSAYEPISWDAFINKYLEAASPGVARVLTSLPGKGSLPPGTGSDGNEKGTADGSPQHPFEVLAEFEMTVTSLAPATSLKIGQSAAVDTPPSHALGIGPINAAGITADMVWHIFPASSVGNASKDMLKPEHLASKSFGAFPFGAWGPAQPREDKKVPKGEVIEALNGALFRFESTLSGRLPKEIDYNRVEPGPRKPLPFVTERNDRANVLTGGKMLSDLLPKLADGDEIIKVAGPWLAFAGNSPLALASIRGDRAAPPRLGSLSERLAENTPEEKTTLAKPDGKKTIDRNVLSPRAIAVLSPMARREMIVKRTTVNSSLRRVVPPSMADADAITAGGIAAKLVRAPAFAAPMGKTLIAAGRVPMSRQGRIAPAAVDGIGANIEAMQKLKALTLSVSGKRPRGEAAELSPGELAVFSMPNARRDTGGEARPSLVVEGAARIVMLGAGGAALSDKTTGGASHTIPQGVERIVVWASPPDAKFGQSGLCGWHAGQSLPYVGWATCLCAGGLICAESALIPRSPESFKAGWIAAKEFAQDSRVVATTFARTARTLILILDEGLGGGEAAFSLTLENAAIERDANGSEIAPALLTSGSRRVLLYPVRTAQNSASFTARLFRDGGMAVVGVMASEAEPSIAAAALARSTPESLLDLAAANRAGPVTAKFAPPPGASRPRGARAKNG